MSLVTTSILAGVALLKIEMLISARQRQTKKDDVPHLHNEAQMYSVMGRRATGLKALKQ